MLLHPIASSFSTDESAVLLTDVAHIPQTAASHQQQPEKQQRPRADVQREDRRDSLYQGVRRVHRARMQLTHCMFSSGKLARNLTSRLVCSALDRQQLP